MTISITPPTCVTRFYGNLDFALEVVANQQIAFVNSSLLNDPFDPYFFFETDFSETRRNLLNYVKINHPKCLTWFRRVVTAEDWEKTRKSVRDYMQYSRDTTFVFSTTAEIKNQNPRSSLYMWGHYGNGHRGVAIEFDARILAEAGLAQSETDIPEIMQSWTKIEYAKKFSPFTAESYFQFVKSEFLRSAKSPVSANSGLEDYIERMVHTKSDVWQFENEWRLMWRNDNTQTKIYKCDIPNDAIKAVTFGLNMPAISRDELSEKLKSNFPKSKVFTCRKRHGDFALDFDELS